MSRYDYGDPGMDPAYCDSLSEPRANANCADCGEDYYSVTAATATRCERCWDLRDAHTTALEEAYLLKRMARCILTADLTKISEVA